MASSSDNAITEEVIKRRLLVDGDGMGDERKLNTLIKSYLSFVDGEDTEENDAASFRRLVGQTKQMEHVARRTLDSIKVNSEAQVIFTDLKEQVQTEIDETKKQIVDSKALLDEATKHRKYSMEYDALAKLIESKPDRKMTDVKRMGLEVELNALRRRKSALVHNLDYRKRTVSVMGSTIERLKELVAADDIAKNKTGKGSRSRNPAGAPMDVDSTSQSEPPSPMEQAAQEQVVNGASGGSETTKSVTSAPAVAVSASPAEKTKSEKYEDLSTSEGEDNS